MENEEILKKVIKKALNNGWQDIVKMELNIDNWIGHQLNRNPLLYIFSHDFAKAFFGENEIEPYKEDLSMYDFKDFETEDGQGKHWIKSRWKYHLMRMVLEEEPIKYLEKFI